MYRWYLDIWMLSVYFHVKPLSISFHNKTFRSFSLLCRQGIDLGPKEVRIHREAGTISIALPAHVVLAVENCKTKLKAGRLLLKWPPVLEGYEKEPFLQDSGPYTWLVIHKSCWSSVQEAFNEPFVSAYKFPQFNPIQECYLIKTCEQPLIFVAPHFVEKHTCAKLIHAAKIYGKAVPQFGHDVKYDMPMWPEHYEGMDPEIARELESIYRSLGRWGGWVHGSLKMVQIPYPLKLLNQILNS